MLGGSIRLGVRREGNAIFVGGLGFEGALPSSRMHPVFNYGCGLLCDWTAVYEGLPVTPIVAHAWCASLCCRERVTGGDEKLTAGHFYFGCGRGKFLDGFDRSL